MSAGLDTLILGSTGPIGKATLAHFQEQGVSACGFSRRSQPALDIADSTELESVMNAFKPRTIIFLVTPPAHTLESSAVVEKFTTSLESVISAAGSVGVQRFLVSSSAAVYGTTQTPLALTETAQLQGASPYARLKQNVEKILERAAPYTAMTFATLRIFNVYGEGANDSLVNKLSGAGSTPVWDTQFFARDYIRVDEVGRALFLAAQQDGFMPTVMNIGSGYLVSNRDLIERLPSPATIDRLEYTADPSYSLADVELAASILGFRSCSDVLADLASAQTF